MGLEEYEKPHLYITATLIYSNQDDPIRIDNNTSYCNEDFRWDEWLSFPLKYNRLSIDSRLELTVWRVLDSRTKIPIAKAFIKFFDSYRMLNKGRHKLILIENADEWDFESYDKKVEKIQKTEVDRLETEKDKYDRKEIPEIDWLDKAVFEKINRIKKETPQVYSDLTIELPTFDFPIVHHEKEYKPNIISPPSSDNTIFDPQNELFDVNVWLPDPHNLPTPSERDQLLKILRYPITKPLDTREKDLLWRIRFHLTKDPKALAPFLRSVDWNNPKQAEQATELLQKWEPLEVADALELLSLTFPTRLARQYAVSNVFRHANDSEILTYLLQLVQAARYELTLAQLLIERALSNNDIAHFLCWYLTVECENPVHCDFYRQMFNEFSEKLQNGFFENSFKPQQDVINNLNEIYATIKPEKTPTAKTKKFQDLIAPTGGYNKVAKLPRNIDFPINPHLKSDGIIQEKVKVFSSSMAPLGMRFRVEGSEIPPHPNGLPPNFNIIFKSGDDLRQDQVIMQIIQLMDRLLKKESLDLKLSPYAVLATGLKHGMLQCVENSMSIAKILDNYKNDIRNYLQTFQPDESNKDKEGHGIKQECIDNFVKSSAGYCVITYLLCIGDRHLDNILVDQSGKLFHVDFGYVAADPKPFPPPMKLSKDMITTMGGAKSKHFLEFKKTCVEAFTVLRRHAKLFLTLIHLMGDSGIEHLKLEATLTKIQDRFHLELSEEQAALELENIIQESADAFFDRVLDISHWLAQYWANRGN